MDLVFKGNCKWDQDEVFPVSGPETLGDWLPPNTAPVSDQESADWLDSISFQDLGLEPASETKQSFDSGVSSEATASLFSEQRTTFGFSDCSFASPRIDLWDPVSQESANFLYQSSEDGGDAVVDDMSMDCVDANVCLQPSEMDLLLNLDMLAVPEQPGPELLFNFPPTPPMALPMAYHEPPQFDFNDPMMYQYQPLRPVPAPYEPDYPALLPVGSVCELQPRYNYNMHMPVQALQNMPPVQAIQNLPPPNPLPPFSSLPKTPMGKRRGPAKTKGTKGVGVGGGKGKRVTFKMGSKFHDPQLEQEIQQVLLPPHLKPPGWKRCQHF